ncbi:MAG TPA: UDP-2,3-diacylglucosamine diphosphatase [Gammaproteobacteria bacterium]|jgi:UDP-2,3-diacylglucosamine hydrolase|nr:UDP-2,3-diacylglucosamine diphosphatase [Gammaproteobacteria bacterium]
MTDRRKTLFISDLHLQESNPNMTRIFCQLIENSDYSVDAIYILGDLFEAWVGDDDESPMYQAISNALQSARKRGIATFFMHGNRDFLIGKKFAYRTGCTLLPEAVKIDLYGTPVLIMHGDTLCSEDVVYLKSRKTARNRFYQTLFLLLPLKIRKQIGERMRLKSYAHTSITPKEIMDVTQTEVERVMQQYHVRHLIHGHTHRPAIHEFTIASQPAERIVLDAWHDRGHAFVWHETGEREHVYLEN